MQFQNDSFVTGKKNIFCVSHGVGQSCKILYLKDLLICKVIIAVHPTCFTAGGHELSPMVKILDVVQCSNL